MCKSSATHGREQVGAASKRFPVPNPDSCRSRQEIFQLFAKILKPQTANPFVRGEEKFGRKRPDLQKQRLKNCYAAYYYFKPFRGAL
jgi:hypothetical protein